jgi:hypothetical protein
VIARQLPSEAGCFCLLDFARDKMTFLLELIVGFSMKLAECHGASEPAHCGARVAFRQCVGGGRHRRRSPDYAAMSMPGVSQAVAAAKSATTAAPFTLERVGRPCSRQNRAVQ